MDNVTPALKDNVLNCLCSSITCESVFSLEIDSVFLETKTDFNTLNTVLSQFERLGFISHLNLRRSSLSLCLHLEAIDFKNRGGFYAQEEVLKLNLEKLLLEIDQLKPSFPDKLETFTSIASNIVSCLGLITLGVK
jgi:hypothetical protein